MFAYDWCSKVYGIRERIRDWERLLLTCLELGFRHLDPYQQGVSVRSTDTKNHPGWVDAVFNSEESEAIADLVHAWTLVYCYSRPEGTWVNACIGRLVGLHSLIPSSPRLRRLVIHFTEISGGSDGVGVEKLVELLDHLHVKVDEVGEKIKWKFLLFGVIQSPGGTQRLSYWYWKLTVKLAVSELLSPELGVDSGTNIAGSLIEAEEWRKLECWIGIAWTLPELVKTEKCEKWMESLIRQRPRAAEKLKKWMEKRSQRHKVPVPESFDQAYRQVLHEAVQPQDAL